MEKETPLDNYKICPATKYLEPNDGTGILPKHKSAFLKAFKKSGDKTKAIELQGFRYSELEWHLTNDVAFRADFKDTLLAMKHELEGLMYENAFKNSGHRERQAWLETNFPEEYGKKAVPKGVKEKSRLDTLLEEF